MATMGNNGNNNDNGDYNDNNYIMIKTNANTNNNATNNNLNINNNTNHNDDNENKIKIYDNKKNRSHSSASRQVHQTEAQDGTTGNLESSLTRPFGQVIFLRLGKTTARSRGQEVKFTVSGQHTCAGRDTRSVK